MADHDATNRNDIPFPIALGLIAFLALNATAVCLLVAIVVGAGIPGWPSS